MSYLWSDVWTVEPRLVLQPDSSFTDSVKFFGLKLLEKENEVLNCPFTVNLMAAHVHMSSRWTLCCCREATETPDSCRCFVQLRVCVCLSSLWTETSFHRGPLVLAGQGQINNSVFVLTPSTEPPVGRDQRRQHSEALWDTR